MSQNTFSELKLAPKLLARLAALKFTIPTPIQQQAIPIALEGRDLIGIAQTGTGKTLAFALPMLQNIARQKRRGLVILPTRELAHQVEESFRQVGSAFGVRTALLIGGASMVNQQRDLRRTPHVLIGTPGRIIDHLQGGGLKLNDVGILVLDEADRMLDMGFAPQIKQILNKVSRDRQTMLFSATMPPEIVKIAANHMRTPVRVEVARAGTLAELVDQELFIVQREQKSRLLHKLIDQYTGTILIFSRTKYGAKKVCRAVRGMGHSVAEIHSNLSLSQRRKSLAGFKSGTYRILVATDIAARGIDVTNIEVVINYDLPDNLDDYVHRVGRTARAGRAGRAISFVAPDQRDKIRIIERIVRQALPISPLPELPPGQPAPSFEYERPERGRHQRQHSRHGSRPAYRTGKPGHQRSGRPAHRTGGRKARVHL
jgi:ATP-dependent RNA helicase RhlE